MYSRFLLALTPLLFTHLALAADCDNATDQATMNQCATQQDKAADKELNALYQQITGRLKSDQDRKVSDSGVEGGSVYPMIYGNCITELTRARVETFKNYLKCQEGDMGCPVPGQT